MEKILIIRLSSIGDIVLTTPIVRTLKTHKPKAKIHFLTKQKYSDLLKYNPNIDKLILFDGNLKETIEQLKAENYDLILDLHNNLRSLIIKFSLRVPAYTFPKENFKKILITKFRSRKPVSHVVLRYAEVLKPLGIPLDNRGLDFFIPADIDEKIKQSLEFPKYNAIVLGGTYKTKKWLPEYYVELINKIGLPVVLLGGATEVPEAEIISKSLQVPYKNVVNTASILESAAYLKYSNVVITHDTGLMHIASAFRKPLLTIWGNTSPLFGMYPYKTKFVVAENRELSCHPCSKLGYDACPKKHFKCIKELTPDIVLKKYKELT